MDIKRGILKALYYDYPVDALVRILDKQHTDMQHDVFLDILPQLLQWAKPEYTYTETNLMRIEVGTSWQNDSRMKDKLPTMYHPLDILPQISEALLTIEHNEPLVRFDQLFRWKDAALYVGEDMLTTAYVAHKDLREKSCRRNLFVWDDILRHNNKQINAVLDEGLSDLHAHFNATSDVFALNWTSLMNDIKQRKKFDEKITRTQEVELMSPHMDYPCDIEQLSVAAAYLRFVFYTRLLNQQADKKEYIEHNYKRKVIRILTDRWFADDIAIDLQNSINWALNYSLRSADEKTVDYCIVPNKEIDSLIYDHATARIIYQGERDLLYSFFYRYYSHDNQCKELAPYMYLYLLIKNKIRREFVQINKIKGFENFETYQDRKDILIPEYSPLYKYYANCVVDTSIRKHSNDHIEARVTPNGLKENLDYRKSLFPNRCYKDLKRIEEKDNLSIVVHFIKNGKYEKPFPTQFNKVDFIHDGTRDEKYRIKIRWQLNDVLCSKINVVGIDAASREIFCRPETFGHIYRYARLKGITGFTYHAGEDFLDIVDGLRSVDEAILFLHLGDRCRIGHGMALGIDAAEYYERRHYTTILPRQYLLDQCIWLLMRSKELNVTVDSNIEALLLDKAEECYNDIGYMLKPFNPKTYWHSMLLRGNDPEFIYTNKSQTLMTKWERTANVEDSRIHVAMGDKQAKDLFHDYYYDADIKKMGMILVTHKWPKEIVRVVETMQEKMRSYVASKHIGIECCPTSNLKIGYIERYDHHPLITKFYPVLPKPNDTIIYSSINTDDRGVFYTSIYEEYSLIALALRKMTHSETNERMYNDREIIRYIGEIRKNAQQMAFRNYTDNK